MDAFLQKPASCECQPDQTFFLQRYRKFLLSPGTLIVLANGILLLAGFLASITGAPQPGRFLYLASALIGGTPLFLMAAKGLILRHDITAGMMASTAMIAAIIVGEYSAAALVVFMMAIGDWLENFTVARADMALNELTRLAPSTITVIRNGHENVIPLEMVIPGDTVLVRSGERIGVDGLIMAGNASINQSSITGESMPVDKKIGDEVFAGTINEAGAIEIRARRVGKETTLGQIVQLVRSAQASQAPVQRVANHYARILVPATFGIAILVYLLTGDILRSITVLVVVCPCALVLATPTAVVAAIGNSARQGVLVKTGGALEQAGKVDAVAFDKTGTLTQGKPTLQEIIALDGMKPDEILNLAASVERYSEHPLGRAIVQAAVAQGLALHKPNRFQALPGFGVTAVVAGQKVMVGNRTLFEENGITWKNELIERYAPLEQEGCTLVPVAACGRMVGLLVLADKPRLEARQAVAELKTLGIKEIVMITGDHPTAARRVAGELDIDRVFAGTLPEEKLNIIRELQANGRTVLFAGDGVNDAPALAAADLGIAMGMGGTDIALETADIGLMTDEIERLPAMLDLSRKTLTVIRQNVIFSMSMNLLSVLLGGFGIIGPVAGALMHELSALPVLVNSARLIGYKKK